MYIYNWGGSLGSIVRGLKSRALVILVLRECIWKAFAVSFIHLTFDDNGPLGSSPRQVVYSLGSMAPPWVTIFRFLAGNREVELKPATFSSLLLFRVFLYFLFS